MKLYYMGVVRNMDKDENGMELSSARDLSSFSFFERNRWVFSRLSCEDSGANNRRLVLASS